MTIEKNKPDKLPAHPCYLGNGEYDHTWKFQDDSFDHEFGTQQINYWTCADCGEERETEEGDYYYDY